MGASWAKMACDLDAHPKIRRAGRSGREVFLFVLRKNAALDHGGRIPRSYADPWYLAEQLMMDESEAASGLSQCVRTGLLVEDGDQIAIGGWDDEWGKRPLTEAERKKLQRTKSKTSAECPDNVRTPSGRKSDSPESHVRDQKREDQKRGEKIGDPPGDPGASVNPDPPPAKGGRRRSADAPREPSGDHQKAIAAFTAYYQRANAGASPTWNAKHASLISGLVKAHGLQEIERRLAVLESSPPAFPPTPWDLPTFVQHFDRCARGQQSAFAHLMAIASGES